MKLSMNQHGALQQGMSVVFEAPYRRNIASRYRSDRFPWFSAGEDTSVLLCLFLGSPYERNVDILKGAQRGCDGD